MLLERIEDAPSLIGAVMTVNALTGFAIPIAVGIWSDRRGRRLPFIAGGVVLTAGGLIAVGLGNGTSYIALGLAAGLVYTGLNALTTAHRAIVAEDVEDARPSRRHQRAGDRRPRRRRGGGSHRRGADRARTGGGVRLATVVLVGTAVPTLLVTRRLRLGERRPPIVKPTARASVRDVLRRPGAREVLARTDHCGSSATPHCRRSSCSTPRTASA